MKFLTVAAAIFASTSLAVPTNNHNGGCGCVPRPDPGNSNTSSAPGGSPTGGHTNSGPATKPTGGHTRSGPATKPTGSHTRSGPATKPTGGHTRSGPGTKPTDGNTSSGPGPKPTGSHTSSAPATTTTGPNTDSHTSSGPSATSTGHPGSGGGVYCPAGLYSSPQCCAVDVLRLADLNCSPPHRTPTSGDEFESICAAVGQRARCCVITVAGQAILCSDPIPVGHPTSVPGGHPTSIPGGHPTSVPGGHPTSIPGGHPTSAPGGNPTLVPGHPAPPSGGNNPISCPSGLYSVAQCCSTDALGVLGLDCHPPPRTPTTGDSFKSICAESGKQAKCCVIPVLGQNVLCQSPPGV